jgi:hypothetical protein
MTTAAIGDFPIERQQRVYADLTVIKGIGPARQQWLRSAFNVHAFQDLAALTLDEIQAKLRESGQIASRHTISQWLVQAKQLMMAGDEPPIRQAAETDKAEMQRPPSNGEWKPFASFVVEFQMRTLAGQQAEHWTKAHHIEEDACANWPGLETAQLCQRMLQQVEPSVTRHNIQRELALKVM